MTRSGERRDAAAIGVLDIFKIGVGPSSSHTMGPMNAARRFVEERVAAAGLLGRTRRIEVRLLGSLAHTGRGHRTDAAVILGLGGRRPDDVDPAEAEAFVAGVLATRRIALLDTDPIPFDPAADLLFDTETPPLGHQNELRCAAFDADGHPLASATWWSVGGGFVVEAGNAASPAEVLAADAAPVPHPFADMGDLLRIAEREGRSIAAIARANELARRPAAELEDGLDAVWRTMAGAIARGSTTRGLLPGPLKVARRAAGLRARLEGAERDGTRAPTHAIDWAAASALAVSEENAAGSRIVTAPTNGAAGVIPAVIDYYLRFCHGTGNPGVRDFLLTAGVIGAIIKTNASISGAEVGCQGEIGSAAAMAAAGLAAALGGTPRQVENAAEIALEHHLGITCDPVAGLVQVPCAERNALGAVKAISAASLALAGDGRHVVSLDQVIETMRQTGADMMGKYKETGLGGLAVNVVAC